MIEGSLPYIEDFEDLWLALKPYRPIAFGTRLARITGHPKDAMLLSQLVYWTRRGRDVGVNGGWIHKTREHWFAETGLSREEQENARRRLRRMNLVTEWRGGRPACLHYRLDVGAMSSAVRGSCQFVGPLPWSIDAIRSDEYAMRELLGPTVAFRRVFVDLVGNLNAALLLSRMLQLQRREADRQCTWFTQTSTEWQRTLGLNRVQLENARARLVRQGLIREMTRHRTGRRVFTQVNAAELRQQLERLVSRADVLDRLATRKSLIARGASADVLEPGAGRASPVIPGSEPAVSRATSDAIHMPYAGPLRNPPTRSPQLKPMPACASPSVTLMHYQWRETYEPIARVYTRITYSTTTTTGLALAARYMPAVVGGSGRIFPDPDHAAGLVWPAMLHAEERALVAVLLGRVPLPDRQVLLDEMAACHRHRPVLSPVAYIAGLVRRSLAGEFVPVRAHLERAARERQLIVERVVAPGGDDGRPGTARASTPETARLHLAAIRTRLRQDQFAPRGDCHA
ncbi:hypothetical protein NE850_18975 [Paraburkholderia sp. USG1]|uniref:hypothetical protein n=1 Tax=Paraburkholderia sp. USG1 TaxID=2952268 RepID=UPI002862E905|nr:hypothetical protein [Paraburkholderia sp. USG1]MDR8398427.1 hypothetical protein [Paraburkholderia sp. USG1]